MAAGPDIRIGDAEREATTASLREHYSRGRLTLEEFQERLDATFAAKTHADLAKITADLPSADRYAAPWPPQPSGPQSSLSSRRSRQRSGWRPTGTRANGLLGVGMVFLLLIFVTVALWPIAAAPRIVVIIFAVFAILRRIFRRIGGRR